MTSPYLKPSRDFGSRCGALVIDSMPPATTTSNSPARISWSASAIASRPDRQTLLMVSAGTVIGMPALTAAWRAGIWPAPACSTWPMITYSTWSGATPARSSAALMATPPRSAPEKSLRRAEQPAHRRARAGDDDGTSHGCDTSCTSVRTMRCHDSRMLDPHRPRRYRRARPRRGDRVLRRAPSACSVVHEEVNEEQGVREAMLAVGDSGSCIQLLAPLSPDSTDREVPRPLAARASSRSPTASTTSTPRRADLRGRGRPAAVRRADARHGRLAGQLRAPEGRGACWSSSCRRPPAGRPGGPCRVHGGGLPRRVVVVG